MNAANMIKDIIQAGTANALPIAERLKDNLSPALRPSAPKTIAGRPKIRPIKKNSLY